MVVFRLSGCIREKSCCSRSKVVVFVLIVLWQKCLYSDKSGCIWVKVVLFRRKCFSSFLRGKAVVFGHKCCNREKRGCMRAKLMYSGKSSCIRANRDCIRARWLYLGKNSYIQVKVILFGQK